MIGNAAEFFGVAVRSPSGSHVVFTHPSSACTLSVPAHKPIKPVSIRHFLELLAVIA